MICSEVWLGGSRKGEGKGDWKVSWVVKEPQSKKTIHSQAACLCHPIPTSSPFFSP